VRSRRDSALGGEARRRRRDWLGGRKSTIQELDRDEPENGLPRVLLVVDLVVIRGVLCILRLTDRVATKPNRTVPRPLTADPAVNAGPYVRCGMPMERGSLARRESEFPDTHVVVAEQEEGAHLGRGGAELGRECLGVERSLVQNVGSDALLSTTACPTMPRADRGRQGGLREGPHACGTEPDPNL
jgi:hypothetical protein